MTVIWGFFIVLWRCLKSQPEEELKLIKANPAIPTEYEAANVLSRALKSALKCRYSVMSAIRFLTDEQHFELIRDGLAELINRNCPTQVLECHVEISEEACQSSLQLLSYKPRLSHAFFKHPDSNFQPCTIHPGRHRAVFYRFEKPYPQRTAILDWANRAGLDPMTIRDLTCLPMPEVKQLGRGIVAPYNVFYKLVKSERYSVTSQEVMPVLLPATDPYSETGPGFQLMDSHPDSDLVFAFLKPPKKKS